MKVQMPTPSPYEHQRQNEARNERDHGVPAAQLPNPYEQNEGRPEATREVDEKDESGRR
jgi:hypothetical protein